MPRKKKPIEQRRVKISLTIHPEIREWAYAMSLRRRRFMSQLFEDLVEAEWNRQKQLPAEVPLPPPQPAQARQPAQAYQYHSVPGGFAASLSGY